MPRRSRTTATITKSKPSGLVSINDFIKERKRIFLSVWARTGVGKSMIPLDGWPKPLFFYNWEPEGPDSAFEVALETGRISTTDEVYIIEPIREALGGDYPELVMGIEEEYLIYEWFKNHLRDVLDYYNTGTIVNDTQTTFYPILREVEMEEIELKREKQKKPVRQSDYAVANRAMLSIMSSIRNRSNMNMIYLSHSQEVYNAKGQSTGRHKYGGNERLTNWVDMHGQLFYETDPDRDDDDANNWFLKVEKCRANIKMRDKDIDAPSYENILAALKR